MTHRDYILNINKKYILNANIYDSVNNCRKLCYITNNDEYIPTNRDSQYFLDDNQDHIFYNLNNEKFERYGNGEVSFIEYPNFSLLNIEDIIDIPEACENNNKGIGESNKIVLDELNVRKENYKKLYTENLKYVDENFLENVEVNKELYIGKTYNDDQFMFNTIFNLLPEDYINKNFNIDIINEKFNEILEYYESIALTELNEEKNSLNEDDQKKEIDSVISLVNDGVILTKKENQSIIEQEDNSFDAIDKILQSWPPILFPVPSFISDDEDDTVFKDSSLLFQEN